MQDKRGQFNRVVSVKKVPQGYDVTMYFRGSQWTYTETNTALVERYLQEKNKEIDHRARGAGGYTLRQAMAHIARRLQIYNGLGAYAYLKQ